MLMNLLLGLATMTFCLAMQTVPLVMVVNAYQRRSQDVSDAGLGKRLSLLIRVMLLLVTGNFIQVLIWAELFMLLDEFSQFSEAVYHSAVNFATLGYGDIVMSDAHKLLGPLQAINGVLMIGVSTAALMAVMQDMLRKAITKD